MRVCNVCGNPMNQGYCVDGGSRYFCSDECLSQAFTPEEWMEEYESNEDSYWTEWTDDDYDGYKRLIDRLKVDGIPESEIAVQLRNRYDYLADDEVHIIMQELF